MATGANIGASISIKLRDAYHFRLHPYGDDGLEINGVNGTIEDWREILLPLLLIERRGERFVDQRKSKLDTISRQDTSVDDPAPDG